MSYTPTTWQTGDVVSSIKLNKLEQGVANAEPLIVTTTADGALRRANYSSSEINTVASSGRIIITYLNNIPYTFKRMSNDLACFSSEYRGSAYYLTINNEKIVNATGIASAYVKPDTGIPENHLAQAVQNKLNAAPVFTITLTPTALDYSGTMDATPAEIYEAYTAGKRIRFWVPSMNASCDVSEYSLFTVGNDTRVSAWANIVFDTGSSYLLMTVITEVEDSTYTTVIFPLGTPSANGESF